MQALRVFYAYFKVNMQQALAYRADTAVNILMNLFWLGWELLSLQIIFGNTTSLSGWGMGEMIALLGVWRMANTLMFAIVWPNTERFNTSIRDGSFDYNLLQPVNSQYLVSISRMVVWRVWEIALGTALIVIGINMSLNSPGSGLATVGALNVASFLVLLVSGMAVLYSLWIVLIAFTFWFVKFDNNVTLLHALMDAGRYPVSVYPAWLRFIVSFIIPIAIATTVPVQALRGDLVWWQMLLFTAIGAAALLISSRVWRAGVKRYSGASA